MPLGYRRKLLSSAFLVGKSIKFILVPTKAEQKGGLPLSLPPSPRPATPGSEHWMSTLVGCLNHLVALTKPLWQSSLSRRTTGTRMTLSLPTNCDRVSVERVSGYSYYYYYLQSQRPLQYISSATIHCPKSSSGGSYNFWLSLHNVLQALAWPGPSVHSKQQSLQCRQLAWHFCWA